MEIEDENEFQIHFEDEAYNQLTIDISRDKITFTLLNKLSLFKYIKIFKYSDIIKELDIPIMNNINEIYDYLINSEYKIIDEEKKIIINNNKEIKLSEKKSTSIEEIIKSIIDEIKDIKFNNNNKIKELLLIFNKNE